jgi:hypothetical protein
MTLAGWLIGFLVSVIFQAVAVIYALLCGFLIVVNGIIRRVCLAAWGWQDSRGPS